jgi:integrase
MSIRVTVKARGVQRERRFPLNTSARTIQDWKDRERGRLKTDRQAPTRGTLTKDVERYLETLVDRPALKKERDYQLEWWIDRFGGQRRSDLTAPILRAALAELRTNKSASTCNHYRLALSHLWTTLDGKNAPNPLRDVPTFTEPEAEPRALPVTVVDLIFGALAKMGSARKGQKRSRVSLAGLRLRVMWRTGLSPAEIMRIQPGDLAIEDRAVYVRRRLKGKGVEGMVYPLTMDGVEAFRAFVTGGAFGPFSTHAVYRCWVRACKRVRQRDDLDAATKRQLEEARPYDLRHTFATFVLQQTGNLKTTQELMRHQSSKTTKRYARAAVVPHLRAAVDAFSADARQPSSSQPIEKKEAQG